MDGCVAICISFIVGTILPLPLLIAFACWSDKRYKEIVARYEKSIK